MALRDGGSFQQHPPGMQAHRDIGEQQGPATLGRNTGLQRVLGLRTEVPESDTLDSGPGSAADRGGVSRVSYGPQFPGL